MNIILIQNEFNNAKNYFSFIEMHPTADGKVYVKVALQTVEKYFYTISINFPETYPSQMPTVQIVKPEITLSPHRYNNGNICYLHPTMWNPGRHDLTFVIQRAAKWLSKYEVWKQTKVWPGAQIKH